MVSIAVGAPSNWLAAIHTSYLCQAARCSWPGSHSDAKGGPARLEAGNGGLCRAMALVLDAGSEAVILIMR